MIPKSYFDQLDNAQRVRNTLPLTFKFDNNDFTKVDKIIRSICVNSEFQRFFSPFYSQSYFTNAIQMTVLWYSNELEFEDVSKPLYRSEVSKIVLFREYFLLSLLSLKKEEYINQIANLSSLRDYAASGCKRFNFDLDHFFLHSSHSMKTLTQEEYLRIDKHKFAPILYPMYEAEIISSILSIVASSLVIYFEIRNEIRDKHSKRNEDFIDTAYLQSKLLFEQGELIRHLYEEMYIRELKIFDLIKSKTGTVEPSELSEIYLKYYFPEMDKIRDDPNYFQSKYPEKYAEINRIIMTVIPTQCSALTKSGEKCTRLGSPIDKFCWQHKNQ